jgi:hypothetical protein
MQLSVMLLPQDEAKVGNIKISIPLYCPDGKAGKSKG